MPGFQQQTVLPPPNIVSLDFLEDLGATQTGNLIVRRGFLNRSPDVLFLTVNTGTVQALNFGGMHWYEVFSQAATINGRSQALLQHPAGSEHAAGFDPITSGVSLLPTRWTVGMVIQRDAPLIANAPLSFGLYQFIGQLSSGVGAGYALLSDTTLNAGRWTVQIRTRQGNPLVNLQDTGIAGTDVILAELVYEDSTNPRISMRVNGQEFGIAQGIANVPQLPTGGGNNWSMGFCQGLNPGGGNGQRDRLRRFRLQVEEMPGYSG